MTNTPRRFESTDIINKHIYILAGINEGIEIIIFQEGNWEFYEDDET